MTDGKSLGPWVLGAALILASGLIATAVIVTRSSEDSGVDQIDSAVDVADEESEPPQSSEAEDADLGDVDQPTGSFITLTGGVELPVPPLPPPHDEVVKPPRAGEWIWGDVGEVPKSAQKLVMDYYEELLPGLGWQLDDYVEDTPQAQFTQVWRPPGTDVLVELNSFSAAGTYTFQVYVCPPAEWCGTQH